MINDVYFKLYDRIATWTPESHGRILPVDRFDHMGFDSLDIAELIMWSEEEFNIEIDEAELWEANIETIGEFAKFIKSMVKEVLTAYEKPTKSKEIG